MLCCVYYFRCLLVQCQKRPSTVSNET
jgi:hypothetical protein